jgi:hypothetical protein
MIANSITVFSFTGLAALAQYIWLVSFPSSSAQANTVLIGTACGCLLFAKVSLHGKWSLPFQGGIATVLTSSLIGAFFAAAAYWTYGFAVIPEAAGNSLTRHGVMALVATTLFTGGWFVGLVCGIAVWKVRRKNIVTDSS